MKRILDKIRKTVKEHNMIQPGDRIVLGLSGGPDSVCMMHALWALQEELGISGLSAVHINHGLRGAESDGDQEYAAQLCERLGVEFFAFRYDVAKEAAAAGIGTEDAGRRIRYQAFEEVRERVGAQKIAVAHNMNDQAETVLMRIMRGTGIAGLSGIPYVRRDESQGAKGDGAMSAHLDESQQKCCGRTQEPRRGMIIRPVLDLARTEIDEYCERAGLAPRIDSTNKESIYTRNRIRLEMLPFMAEHFNPNIENALVRLSKQAAEDNDFIQQAAEAYINENKAQANAFSITENKAHADCVSETEKKSCSQEFRNQQKNSCNTCRFDRENRSLDIQGFAELHPAVAKRVILTCASLCGLEYNISSVHVDRVMGLIAAGSESKEVDLTQNYYARLSYGKLWFTERSSQDTKIAVPIDFPFQDLLMSGKAVISAAGKEITFKITEKSADYDGSRHHRGADLVGYGAGEYTGAREDSRIRAFMDFDRLLDRKNAVIRNRMPGDRISPKGMKGSKKLQDYFTDRKIPKHMRDGMLLIVDGGKVLLAGSEAAGECCETADSRRILSIEY